MSTDKDPRIVECEKLLSRASTKMLTTKELAFYSTMYLSLKQHFSDDIPTACTDGKSIDWSPEWVTTKLQDPRHLLFVMVHEVEHVTKMHHVRMGDRDPELWNVAADYEINAELISLQLPILQMPPDGLYEPAYAGKTTEQIYAILRQRQQSSGNSQQQSNSANSPAPASGQTPGMAVGLGSGQPAAPPPAPPQAQTGLSGQQSLSPGQSPAQNANPGTIPPAVGQSVGQPGNAPPAPNSGQFGPHSGSQPPPPSQSTADPGVCGGVRAAAPAGSADLALAEQDTKALILAAANSAKFAGHLPAGIRELVKEIRNPKEDFARILRDYVEQITANDYSWSQPSRRHIARGMYLPSLYTKSLGRVVIAADTSGSINTEVYERFMGVAQWILDFLKPECLHFIQCDTRVEFNEEFYPGDDLPLDIKGRGGTAFKPVFDAIEQGGEDPLVMLFLTDMYAEDIDRLSEPDYPVIWVAYDTHVTEGPFGKFIKVED